VYATCIAGTPALPAVRIGGSAALATLDGGTAAPPVETGVSTAALTNCGDGVAVTAVRIALATKPTASFGSDATRTPCFCRGGIPTAFFDCNFDLASCDGGWGGD